MAKQRIFKDQILPVCLFDTSFSFSVFQVCIIFEISKGIKRALRGVMDVSIVFQRCFWAVLRIILLVFQEESKGVLKKEFLSKNS